MHIVLALFLLLHGIAHVVGFAGSYGLAKNIPYTTAIVGGRYDVGDAGMRLVGLLWLLAALGFGVAAVGVAFQAAWWPIWTGAVAAFSLTLSITGWPRAKVGVAIDVLLVGLLVVMLYGGWNLGGV